MVIKIYTLKSIKNEERELIIYVHHYIDENGKRRLVREFCQNKHGKVLKILNYYEREAKPELDSVIESHETIFGRHPKIAGLDTKIIELY